MSTLATILMERWDTARQATLKVARAVPPGRESFRPDPAAMSLGEIVLHILSTERTVYDALSRPSGRWEWQKGFTPDRYPHIDGILEELAKQTALTRVYLLGLGDAELETHLDLPWGVRMTLDHLWYDFIVHEIYHRGNLVTTLRAAGVTPPNTWPYEE